MCGLSLLLSELVTPRLPSSIRKQIFLCKARWSLLLRLTRVLRGGILRLVFRESDSLLSELAIQAQAPFFADDLGTTAYCNCKCFSQEPGHAGNQPFW
jgi:hypothetical protein